MNAFKVMSKPAWLLIGAITLIVQCVVFSNYASACPFCGEKTRTYSELLAESDFAALVQWVSSTGENDEKHETKYEIVQVVRDASKAYKVGQTLTFDRRTAGKPGNLALALGKKPRAGKSELAEWRDPIEMSEVAFQYILQAPPPEAPSDKRLTYFARFLEYPDPLIAADAYGEFGNASYQETVPVARKIDPVKLRKWIFTDDLKIQPRRGLYGMMLGLTGDEKDAARLEAVIRENPTDDIRLGINGMIGGYLLLKKAAGLKLIEETKLVPDKIPFSETFAALEALRFMWAFGDGRISREQLKQSMRLVLDRHDIAELAIIDLARWKDWDIQQRLFKLYGSQGEYQQKRLKKSIIGYMIASTRDKPKSKPSEKSAEPLPEHVLRGREYLDKFREEDPELVAEVEKTFR